jgi:hypothetical protein
LESPALTPSERSLRASLAAHSLHAQRDSRELTKSARLAFADSFRQKAIEAAAAKGEKLTEAEVDRRAEHLRLAHFPEVALASARSRRKKAS